MRKETIGDCTLYLGNCRTLVGHLHPDAVVSDPPYGIGHRRGRAGDRGKSAITLGTVGIQNDERPFDPNPFLCWPAVLWGADHYAERLPRGRWLLWDKTLGGGSGDFSDFEVAWCSRPGASKIFRHLWMGVQRDSQVGQPRLHPTEKPVALLEWCLGFLPDFEVILDPYMGSGTTAIACIKQGRPFIGVEIDPVYFETACRRIEAAYAQPDIFIEHDRKQPIQEPLFGEAAE